mmetsp:Transcript_53950/g.101262  ORF Transcript_53950/g.101262 Transcript_53950/m.101262 type:complete len:86 (+) Transcript_53950:105-362(+)
MSHCSKKNMNLIAVIGTAANKLPVISMFGCADVSPPCIQCEDSVGRTKSSISCFAVFLWERNCKARLLDVLLFLWQVCFQRELHF